jgi:hypothetical protein
MKLLLAFAPFAVFAVAERAFGTTSALLAGGACSIALLLRDRLRTKGEPKILEAGTALVFCALAALALLGWGDAWTVAGVRLRVDAGLFAIAVVSIAVRRPFTLQYAASRVPQEVARSARFLRTNMVITCAWAAAFAVLSLADLALVLRPESPLLVPVLASVAALAGAMKFSTWYARRAAR